MLFPVLTFSFDIKFVDGSVADSVAMVETVLVDIVDVADVVCKALVVVISSVSFTDELCTVVVSVVVTDDISEAVVAVVVVSLLLCFATQSRKV